MKRRHPIQHVRRGEHAHRERRHHRRNRQRPKALHRDGAKDDLRHEKRSRDRRIVSRGDTRRRAARHDQRSCGGVNCRHRPTSDASIAASCTIGPSRPIEPPDPMENSAAVHLHEAGPDRHPPVADRDGLHVVRRALPFRDALAKHQHKARARSAQRRHQRTSPAAIAASTPPRQSRSPSSRTNRAHLPRAP